MQPLTNPIANPMPAACMASAYMIFAIELESIIWLDVLIDVVMGRFWLDVENLACRHFYKHRFDGVFVHIQAKPVNPNHSCVLRHFIAHLYGVFSLGATSPRAGL